MKIGHLEIGEKLRAQCNSLILGSPGFGKSVFMELMMRKDLEQRQPFCFIDLHGSTFQRLKKWCAFNAYYDRKLTLLDPSEGKYVKPCDPSRKKEGVETGAQSSSEVESMLSAWGDKNPNSYPVMFKLMKILFTVMIEKGIPFHRGFQLLADQKAMTSVVAQLSDANIKTLWADLAKLSSSEWIRQVTPTLNRLFRIVQSKAIQRFMCTQSDDNLTLTFEDTILVNLATSGELDSDAARTFAVLLLNDLYLSAKRRRGVAESPPSPYFVYVDEWIQAPTPDFGRILAETRKFGLLLVLANQDLSQIKTVFGGGFKEGSSTSNRG